MVRALALAVLLLAAGSPARAFVRYYPVYGADLSVGQIFFNGSPSAWSGNMDLRAVPAVKFSDTFLLIPSAIASYQGTKDVAELAGGSQLFRDSAKLAFNVRPIVQVGSLRLKPQLGWRMDLLRETKDEKWGKGLFDYRKAAAGLEAEWILNERQWLTFGGDLYSLRFPNYDSLESEQPTLGRENAGTKTLDSDNTAFSASWNTDTPFPNVRLSAGASFLSRSYPEQRIVDSAGQLGGGLRKDTGRTYTASLGWSRALGGVDAALFLEGSQSLIRSGQNHYDASSALFIPNFYSYDESALRPSVEFSLKRKGRFSLSYLWGRRDYQGRPTQDANGAYQSAMVQIKSRTLAASLSIPVAEGFKATAAATLTTSDSNQAYEKLYRYNYNISSQMIGLSYEY